MLLTQLLLTSSYPLSLLAMTILWYNNYQCSSNFASPLFYYTQESPYGHFCFQFIYLHCIQMLTYADRQLFSFRLAEEYTLLVQQRDRLLRKLEKNVVSQKYLERVLEAAEEFHEIREVIARFDTLTSTHEVWTCGTDKIKFSRTFEIDY